MTRCRNLGTIIIDELKLCYRAEPDTHALLKEIDLSERVYFRDLIVQRISDNHCKYFYNILNNENECIAYLYFGLYMYNENTDFVWIKVDNHILYTENVKEVVEIVKQTFNLSFNNITSLDLAIDTTFNICYAITRNIRNKTLTTIINRKAVKDRKRVIKEITYNYGTTSERLVNPTIYIAQKKAVANKHHGLHLKSYNKLAEINESSQKQYILDYYNNPKTLHRIEIHQNRDDIIDFLKNNKRLLTEDIIYDKEILSQMFFGHISRIIRFTNTKSRRKIDWRDILRCNARAT